MACVQDNGVNYPGVRISEGQIIRTRLYRFIFSASKIP